MKHIELFEQWIPKLSTEPVPISKVGSFGQRITDNGTKKIKKQDIIFATDKNIKKIVRDEIKQLGKKADLNHIDVSQVTDMSHLFQDTDFQGDVSDCDVSRVEDMYAMFYGCWYFNCDISDWKVDKVQDMKYMFYKCKNFNQDLSKWKVSNVKYKNLMFSRCSIKEEFKPKF